MTVVKLDVVNRATGGGGGGGGSTPPTSPWGYSVLANGYIVLNGQGTAFAYCHANSYITCNGNLEWGNGTSNVVVSSANSSQGFLANGQITVHGTVRAPKITINGNINIDHQIVTNVATVTFPTPDLTSYYNIALANGQVNSSALTLNGNTSWGAIAGGVKWVNGAFTANGSLSYSGCIIATGNMTFNGVTTQTRVGDLPAAVSRDGTVVMNGSHTVEGLVFSKGDLTWNGQGSIAGSVLCGGNLTFNGSYGIVSYKYSEPGTAAGGGGGGGSGGADKVGISAWQK